MNGFLVLLLIFIMVLVLWKSGSAESKLEKDIGKKIDKFKKHYEGVEEYLINIMRKVLKEEPKTKEKIGDYLGKFIKSEKIKTVKDFQNAALLVQNTFLTAEQILAKKKFGKNKIKYESLGKKFDEFQESDFKN